MMIVENCINAHKYSDKMLPIENVYRDIYFHIICVGSAIFSCHMEPLIAITKPCTV